MNCEQIAHLLDERETTELAAAEAAELEAHMARCSDCAEQRLASQSMSSFRADVPPLPASLQERARELSGVCEAARSGRSRRPVLVGSLCLLGIAATMLAPLDWTEGERRRSVV